jgi:hypothetical protein
MNKWPMAAGAALLLLPTAFAGIAPGRFDFSTFNVPNLSALSLSAINNRGQVVGYDDFGGVNELQGFLRSRGGTLTTLQDPLNTTATYTQADGINDFGTVVGFYLDNAHNQYSGFLYSEGVFTTYNVPGLAPGSETDIIGINDEGDFCGDYRPSDLGFPTIPFINHGGTVTSFTIAGATFAECISINNHGVAAGYYYDGTKYHGFVRRRDGTLQIIDLPGTGASLGTALLGINDHGWTSGHFYDAANIEHGFLRSPGGRVYQIDVPGAAKATVFKGTAGGGLNNDCTVAGHWDPADGSVARGYIARPDFECGEDDNDE